MARKRQFEEYEVKLSKAFREARWKTAVIKFSSYLYEISQYA